MAESQGLGIKICNNSEKDIAVMSRKDSGEFVTGGERDSSLDEAPRVRSKKWSLPTLPLPSHSSELNVLQNEPVVNNS